RLIDKRPGGSLSGALGANECHSISSSTCRGARCFGVAFHMPRLANASQPQRNQLSSFAASHTAQANIAARHTHEAVLNTHGRVKLPLVRSVYQINSRLLLPLPNTCISGVLSRPS